MECCWKGNKQVSHPGLLVSCESVVSICLIKALEYWQSARALGLANPPNWHSSRLSYFLQASLCYTASGAATCGASTLGPCWRGLCFVGRFSSSLLGSLLHFRHLSASEKASRATTSSKSSIKRQGSRGVRTSSSRSRITWRSWDHSQCLIRSFHGSSETRHRPLITRFHRCFNLGRCFSHPSCPGPKADSNLDNPGRNFTRQVIL